MASILHETFSFVQPTSWMLDLYGNIEEDKLKNEAFEACSVSLYIHMYPDSGKMQAEEFSPPYMFSILRLASDNS